MDTFYIGTLSYHGLDQKFYTYLASIKNENKFGFFFFIGNYSKTILNIINILHLSAFIWRSLHSRIY